MARSLTHWSVGHPNGRIGSRPSPLSIHPWWRGISQQGATAALVVLVLAAGLFAAGPLRSNRGATEPVGIPAVVMAPATPTPDELTEETLLEVTIPAELLPQGDRISAVFEQATSPAGSTGRWLAANSADQPGLRLHYVVDGSVVMRAEGDAQVLRAGAGSVLEGVPAGTEVTLGTGDTWIIRNETVFEAVNPTEEPTEVLLWVVANIEDSTGFLNYPMPSNWTEDSYYVAQPGVELPPGPVTLRIRRVALPAKGRLPAPADGLQYGVAMLSRGTPGIAPSIANLPDGRLANNGRKTVTAYVLNVASAEAEAGPAASGTPGP